MGKRLRQFLDVRPGEGRPVLYTFLYVAVAVGSFLLAKAIRNGLFLEEFGASKLVYVYVAVPLVLSVLVPIYTTVNERIGPRFVITGSLVFLSVNVLAFWWALTYHPARWLSAAFYVWVNCYGVIAPVQAWTFANAVFDTRQARRLFGLVGSGASVGAIVGGLTARTLVAPLGTVNLLLVLAMSIAAAAVVVNLAWHVRRRERDRARPAQPASRAGRVPLIDSLRLIARTPYLRHIAMLVMLVAIVTQWTLFQFQSGADQYFAGDGDRLVRFFGDFNSIMGAVALLVQVFATGPALRRFGLGVTILVLPLLLGGGVLAIALTGSLVAVVATNAFDQGLRFSVDKATFELLYLPLDGRIKNQVKGTIDLILNRVADGIGGVLLGLATTGFLVLPGLGLGVRGVAMLTLPLIAAWAFVAMTLRRGYVGAIQDSIHQHRLDAERAAGRGLDKSATQVLAAHLKTAEPKQILYALEVFRLQHRGATHPAVRGLLHYPVPDVRRQAIAVLDDADDVGAVAEVEALLNDPDPGVRAEALLFLARHVEIDPLERITTFTDFPDYSVQACLVAFLGRESAWQNVEAARVVLRQMIDGDGPSRARARLEAARLLGHLGEGFEDELAALVQDQSEDVARAAVQAAAHPDRADLAPLVLERLADPACREAASDSLAAMGPGVVPVLRDALEDLARPVAIRVEIPRILSTLGGPEARDILVDNLFEADVTLRTQIIAGLGRLHARHPDVPVDRNAVEMALTAEIMGHYRSYQILGRLGTTFAEKDPVTQGLHNAIEQEQERIFRLLDPLLPDADMKSVHVGLRSATRTIRANALELLDNVLSPGLRELVVPLFDGQVPVEERVALANRLVGAAVETREDAARAMLASEDPWLKSCGVYAAAALRLQALRPEIERLAAAANPLLRETARVALVRLSAAAEAPATRRPTVAPRPAPAEAGPMPAGTEEIGVG